MLNRYDGELRYAEGPLANLTPLPQPTTFEAAMSALTLAAGQFEKLTLADDQRARVKAQIERMGL